MGCWAEGRKSCLVADLPSISHSDEALSMPGAATQRSPLGGEAGVAGFFAGGSAELLVPIAGW